MAWSTQSAQRMVSLQSPWKSPNSWIGYSALDCSWQPFLFKNPQNSGSHWLSKSYYYVIISSMPRRLVGHSSCNLRMFIHRYHCVEDGFPWMPPKWSLHTLTPCLNGLTSFNKVTTHLFVSYQDCINCSKSYLCASHNLVIMEWIGTQRYMNKLLIFTFTTSYYPVVCFYWLLF